ncbi:MAG: GTP cyclohydrolase II [Polyangiaceae bacterium]|nr:GTP cyclohydrolase II [Polyangiaceae bacterium]
MKMPKKSPIVLQKKASAPLPTAYGQFELVVFNYPDPEASSDLSQDHIALIMGEMDGAEDLPVRIHSECITGEVFDSMKCDCRQQLQLAQQNIAETGRGAIIYLRQEGRGIGLANKIKAYALQADGADTIAANELLHLPIDARRYDVAAEIVQALGIRSIQLMTNNPEKKASMERLGIRVTGRIPVHVPANRHSENYLSVKRDLMQHHLPEDLNKPRPS